MLLLPVALAETEGQTTVAMRTSQIVEVVSNGDGTSTITCADNSTVDVLLPLSVLVSMLERAGIPIVAPTREESGRAIDVALGSILGETSQE